VRRYIDDQHRVDMMGERYIRSQWETFRVVFFYGDTVTVRAILMVASYLQAVGFFLPFGTMTRPYYADMRFLPGWAWGVAFTLHGMWQWWRFRSRPNMLLGFLVNLYGFLLWTFTTLLGTLATHTYSPATALEWTVIVALFAALIRTGDHQDRMSP
jgi:hypothetical protein